MDISDVVKDSGFGVFRNAIGEGGMVGAIVAPSCSDYSRQQVKELENVVKEFGAAGLISAAVSRNEEGEEILTSQVSKFLTDAELSGIARTTGAKEGDLVLIVAGSQDIVLESLGRLRLHLGSKLDLIPEEEMAFVWITEFPMFEFSQEEQRLVAVHHRLHFWKRIWT